MVWSRDLESTLSYQLVWLLILKELEGDHVSNNSAMKVASSRGLPRFKSNLSEI